MDEWISVKDKLPESTEDVLIYNGRWIDVGCYMPREERFYSYAFPKIKRNVTHWTPLPEPPKEDA